MKLNSDQIVFHPLSGFDPVGRLFWWEGNLYRAISRERTGFYERLLAEGIVRDLVQRKLIIETEGTDLKLDGYGLVVKHQTVPFVSHCSEWCGEMLKAAALHVLQLETELLKYGLTLDDPHPRNVLFLGPAPVWVDLGALSPVCDVQSELADEEFSAHYTRPLKIMAAGHPRIARCLLRDGPFSHVEQREVEAITGAGLPDEIQVAKAGVNLIARKIVPPALRPVARRAVERLLRPTRSKAAQGSMNNLERAVREVENIRLLHLGTEWSAYDTVGFPEFDSTTEWTAKHCSILQILTAKKPASVLDVGSNRGWYSQLAARHGAQVVSVDFDERSVAKLFADSVRHRLPILPLVMNFCNLSPAMTCNDAPGIAATERLRCEMVFALALVHHLVFTEYMSFERIVAGLAAVARRWLVVEFVGPEDQHVRGWMNSWYDWYTLDNFLAILSREFRSINEFPSNAEHRRVLLCQR